MFEQKFKAVEQSLRPRNKFKHDDAVGLLGTVVREADTHIEQLEEENELYKAWLIIAAMTNVIMGFALFYGN